MASTTDAQRVERALQLLDARLAKSDLFNDGTVKVVPSTSNVGERELRRGEENFKAGPGSAGGQTVALRLSGRLAGPFVGLGRSRSRVPRACKVAQGADCPWLLPPSCRPPGSVRLRPDHRPAPGGASGLLLGAHWCRAVGAGV